MIFSLHFNKIRIKEQQKTMPTCSKKKLSQSKLARLKEAQFFLPFNKITKMSTSTSTYTYFSTYT